MKLGRIRPEVFILILIIACITYIISYDNNTGRNGAAIVIDESGHISILHNQKDIAEHQKKTGKEIVKYRPDACQLIEVYNENYESIFSLSFTNNHDIYDYIETNASLKEAFSAKKNGVRSINVDNIIYNVDYAWDTVNNTNYLIVYVSGKTEESSITIFNILCYLTLILSLTLFTNSLYWNSRNLTRRYKQVRKEVNSRIR